MVGGSNPTTVSREGKFKGIEESQKISGHNIESFGDKKAYTNSDYFSSLKLFWRPGTQRGSSNQGL